MKVTSYIGRHLSAHDKAELKRRYRRIEKRITGCFFRYGVEELRAAFRAMGVEKGNTLMIHSSFNPMSGFQGTPSNVISALIDVLGPEGNLLMVSIPFSSTAHQYLVGNPVFDVNRTVSQMGIISETFRRKKGVLRSLHPTHPVLAFGKDAAWIVKDHEKIPYPCGVGTPFDKLRALDGKVLFFDVPFGNFTFIHYLEDLFKDRIPIPVYRNELFPARVRDSRGQELLIWTRAFTDEDARRRNPEILKNDLVRNGMLKKMRIGRTRLMLVRCEDAVRCTDDMLKRNTCFYDNKSNNMGMSRISDKFSYLCSLLDGDLAVTYLAGKRNLIGDDRVHLDAAIRWICRAQDASGDGGVARSYSLVYSKPFQRKGWIPSYPETTGYIIPTLFDYAHDTGSQEVFDRAVRMAEWECGVQMESGAIQGGTVWHDPNPAIFNTGQVVFGWVRAFRETGNEKYFECAVKAGQYLVGQQDEDGAWRKNLSRFTSSSMPYYAYNTRTAWALLVLSLLDGNRSFRDGATRNIEFTLMQQSENGYFDNNCLNDPSQALLHTVAYCLQGILEAGIILNSRVFVEKVAVAADSILGKIRKDGSFPGRFHPDWKPAVAWSCLTGNSQMSIILGRLYQVTGDMRYLEGMKKTNIFQKRVQVLRTGNPDLYGGITGSYPVHGSYGKYEILSWAVKFFIDALMLEKEIVENRKMLPDLSCSMDRSGG